MQGTADFARSGNTLTVTQHSDRAIIHWDDFSIASGELTQFNQPSSTAAALNRVTGSNPSALYGTLRANGILYLLNPNGILVGAGGTIETGGFIASTLDLSDDDFMAAGTLNFSGASNATIEVDGLITATEGDIVLIAREIDQRGTLSALQGDVLIGAASEVLLMPEDTEGQRIFVQAGTGTLGQHGLIEAARAELRAAGGNPYALAINHSGTTRVNAVAERGGDVWLVASTGETRISGNVSAQRGDNGGDIRALGENVTLATTATLEATGDNGGGSILVGGDFQGGNSDILNASLTHVEAGVVLDASALANGDGGTVIVWADDATAFHGHIAARGGADGGNGGFTEVSGKHGLSLTGTFDLNAPHGNAGDILLDPDTLEIVTGAAGALPGPGAGAHQVSPATVLAALTGGNVTLTANVSITVTDDIIAPGANTNNLIFNAGAAGDLFLNASTIDVGGGELTFQTPATVNAADLELIADTFANEKTITAGAAANSLTITADDMDIQDTIDYLGKNVTLRPRSAGAEVDLGTRTDTVANRLELSNPEIMFVDADIFTIGRIDSGDMFISQKISPTNVNTLHLITGGDLDKGVPSAVPIDLSTWSIRGVAGAVDGVWTVLGGGTAVTQDVNAQTPTFFISNDTSGYVGVVFEGQLQVDPATTDNDFIGFVFGVQEPTAVGDNEFDFYLFDWVQGNFVANNKFMLSKVDDPANVGTHSSNNLWTRTDNATVDALQVNSNTPWAPGVAYDFRLTYSTDNITAEVKGGAFGGTYVEVINYDNPDPVGNPFPAGDFGFYNFSQDHSQYSNFTLTESPSMEISGGNLAITAAGSVTLTEKVDIASIAIDAGGDIDFKDDNGFTITTLAGVSGINANGNNVFLESLSNVTQDAAIQANELEITGATGNFALTSNNQITTVAANTGDLSFRDDDGFVIGTIGTTNGLTATGDITLTSSGNVTQTQAISASGLAFTGAGGDFVLTHAGNDATTLAANTGSLSYRDTDTLAIGTVDTTVGLTTTGNISIHANTLVSQTAPINTDGLVLLGAATSYILNHANNAINTIALSANDLTLTNSQSLTIGTVGGTVGISTTGNVIIQTTGATSDITLDEAILADTDANAGATSETIVLASGDDFHNNAGAAALQTGGGRFLVYSEHPDQNTLGGLTADPLYGSTYAGNPPNTINPADESRFVYSVTPTLIITPDDLQRFYGSANPPLTTSVSGLIGGDALADVLSGAGVTSTAAAAASDAGDYAINLALGTLATNFGYNIVLGTGTLTVAKAPLVITADHFSREYGLANPALTYQYSGFVLGQDSSVLDVLPDISTVATISSDVGTYQILLSGGSDNNYAYTLDPGTLEITPATLIITAEDAQRGYYQNDPAFSATATGLRAGDTLADLDNPVLFRTDAKKNSLEGFYRLEAYGAGDLNYTISYVDGLLEVISSPIGDYILVGGETEDDPTKLVRLFGGDTQGSYADHEFLSMNSQSLLPPWEFPARLAERGQNRIVTTAAWIDKSPADSSGLNAQLEHGNFLIVYRDKGYEAKTLFEGSVKTAGLSILSMASYHDFLEREPALQRNLSLLSEGYP